MKLTIVKRVADLEKFIVQKKIKDLPTLVIISYDHFHSKWKIQENYPEVEDDRVFFLDHYRDYIFRPKLNARVMLDLLSCPEDFGGNLYSFSSKELFKGVNKNCGVSIEYGGSDPEDSMTSVFNLTIHEPENRKGA